MEKDRKFRALAIAAICVAIVGVSVAYAALTASLNITGTATVDTKTGWNLFWVTTDEGTAKKPSLVADSKTITLGNVDTQAQTITWNATFTAPNTGVTLTAYIKNGGKLNAKLLENGATTDYLVVSGVNASSFDTTVTIGDQNTAAGTKKGSVLLPNGIAKVVVNVKLKNLENDAFGELTQGEEGKVTFTLTLPFEQAADDVTTPLLGA